MKVKNIAISELAQSIKNVNRDRDYKLIFNREPEFKGKWLHFTIRSETSGIPGSRTSASGINMTSASWHAHGYLFDEILKRNPEALINTMVSEIYTEKLHTVGTPYEGGVWIVGNWVDYPIGSNFAPVNASEVSIL